MMRWWTADIHFGHGDVARYCNRPTLRKKDLDEKGNWVSDTAALNTAARTDKMIISNFNSRVKPEDSVICVGDFLNYGKVKTVPGLRNKPGHYLKHLKGVWTLLEGNHDPQNNVKTTGRILITHIAKKRVFVSHYPTNSHLQDPVLMDWVRKNCAFAIVGHIHDKWSEYLDKGFININVGVDVRNYQPINDSEVFGIYEKKKRRSENGN